MRCHRAGGVALDCGSDPDETVAQIAEYVDAGFNHLVFHAPGHDQARFLTAFENDLAPRLRALA